MSEQSEPLGMHAIEQILLECSSGIRTMAPAFEVATGMHDKGYEIIPRAPRPATRHDNALSDDALFAQMKDLDKLIQSLNGAIGKARSDKAKIQDERTRRGLKERGVSEHAIVRYLERVRCLDIEAIRTIIRQLADDAVAFAKCDGHWHAESGTLLILNDDGDVVTILGREQAEKYLGRRLTDGAIAGNAGVTISNPEANSTSP